jgi:hypothetical protein
VEDLHVHGVFFFQDHLAGLGTRCFYDDKSDRGGVGGMSVPEFILST